MAPIRPFTALLSTFALFLIFSTPVAAFGAGSIIKVSAIAGKNWRHGDIEDVLLELYMSHAGKTAFDSLAVKRVYFVSRERGFLPYPWLFFMMADRWKMLTAEAGAHTDVDF
jgi:hypothetical protein